MFAQHVNVVLAALILATSTLYRPLASIVPNWLRPDHSTFPTVATYVTTADGSRLFARERSGPQFTNKRVRNDVEIVVDDSRRFQTVDGFGAALTGSSAHLLASLPDHGSAVLTDLFGSDAGIGLSYVRLSIGASDFSLGSYTYDDVARGRTDPALSAFSVASDDELFSVVKTVQATSSDVKFMASPWTAPAWMKSPRTLVGGRLRRDAYAAYARYLVSYLRAMQKRGVTFDSLTPENEPLAARPTSPAMALSAPAEADFIRVLGPALKASFPDVKLVAYDGNWDPAAYPLSVLHDGDAARYIAGTAFHCYEGDVARMSDVRRTYPQKAIYLSECGGGDWSRAFGDNLGWDMQNLIIGATSNWARIVLLWNLALDDSGGPKNHGCSNCRGVVTIHSNGSVTRNVEYYVLAHIAKFVRPGAVRIASSSPSDGTLPNVAFLNPDGSKVLIAYNNAPTFTSFTVRFANVSFGYSLPAGAAATFRWP